MVRKTKPYIVSRPTLIKVVTAYGRAEKISRLPLEVLAGHAAKSATSPTGICAMRPASKLLENHRC